MTRVDDLLAHLRGYEPLDFYAAEMGVDDEPDEVFYAALEEGLFIEPVGDDARRYIDRPDSFDRARMRIDPLGELLRLTDEAGGTLVVRGSNVGPGELYELRLRWGVEKLLDLLRIRPIEGSLWMVLR